MNCILKMLVLAATLASVACSTTPMRTQQELARGKSNFESGLFRDAFHQLLPPATEGNREAQYAVGYMYYYGYGVAEDRETGIFWIQKSASQQYQPAIDALTAIRKAR